MNAPIRWLVVLLLLLSPLSPAASARPEPESAGPAIDATAAMASLTWLEGRWSGAVGGGTWEAVYTAPSGCEVLSTNKEIRRAQVVSFEFERFHIQAKHVVMTPYVKGVKRVDFTLVENDPKLRRAVFTNPKHDFPTRIVYHREKDAVLRIKVLGKRGGFELVLKRR